MHNGDDRRHTQDNADDDDDNNNNANEALLFQYWTYIGRRRAVSTFLLLFSRGTRSGIIASGCPPPPRARMGSHSMLVRSIHTSILAPWCWYGTEQQRGGRFICSPFSYIAALITLESSSGKGRMDVTIAATTTMTTTTDEDDGASNSSRVLLLVLWMILR